MGQAVEVVKCLLEHIGWVDAFWERQSKKGGIEKSLERVSLRLDVKVWGVRDEEDEERVCVCVLPQILLSPPGAESPVKSAWRFIPLQSIFISPGCFVYNLLPFTFFNVLHHAGWKVSPVAQRGKHACYSSMVHLRGVSGWNINKLGFINY